MSKKRILHLLILTAVVLSMNAVLVSAQSGISIVHYYSDALGQEVMGGILQAFNEANPDSPVADNSAGHEDFKTQILVTIAGDNPPDIFSYWAGARTQFIVDADRLMPLDDWWAEAGLDEVIPAGVKSAGIHNGQIYNVPMNVHVVGFFYNPKVMEAAGITEMPRTWDEFLTVCETLKESGVTPIALGSRNRWPAQYWFDYTVSRTAGPEYRTKLMNGEAKYTDPEVQRAMEFWKELVDAGYFVPDANAYDWDEAANMVANGDAAMTLMGTWITGLWNGNGLEPVTDYDFFPFPIIDPEIPEVVHGSIDGWVIPANAKNAEGGKAVLAWMLSPEVQQTWAIGQGALAASTAIDQSAYTPVMAKAAEYLAGVDFLSGYDLSTTPPMAEGGLDMFAMFMNDPSGYLDYLAETQIIADDVFGG
jgi:ABC-type glycerol-3-phosphate transport system substrate-binding protein